MLMFYNMILNFECRYDDPDVQQFLLESSCLDARFKTMAHIDVTAKHRLYSTLTNKIAEFIERQNTCFKVGLFSN